MSSMLVSVLSAVSIKVVGNQRQLPQIVHRTAPPLLWEKSSTYPAAKTDQNTPLPSVMIPVKLSVPVYPAWQALHVDLRHLKRDWLTSNSPLNFLCLVWLA